LITPNYVRVRQQALVWGEHNYALSELSLLRQFAAEILSECALRSLEQMGHPSISVCRKLETIRLSPVCYTTPLFVLEPFSREPN
jgi:hypothetical protein